MKIKRMITAILLFGSILGVAGCGNNTSTPADFDEAALQTRSETAVISMVNGDFTAVTEQFSADVKAQLSTEALQASWVSVVEPIGAYLGHYQTSGEITDDYYVVQVISRFEMNGLLTTVTFNRAGEIAGLWINYKTIDEGPLETDAYQEFEMRIGEYDLSALLTLPVNAENPPVVLLIQGSGATDKNETIGAASNTPFADIAHGLAKQGIATLRFDKRYYAHPELAEDMNAVTVETEVLDDAYTAIDQLVADERIDNQRIFVLGHSLGGMLAPKIAADNSVVSGIIIMAGSLRNLAEISLDQNQEAADAMRPTLSDEEKALLDTQMVQVEADVAAILALTKDDGNTYLSLPAAYWYSLNQAGGLNYLDQLSIPMLILQGSEDFQVYPDRDFVLWQAYCADDPLATLILYDGLNHLFMESSGLRATEDYDTPNQVRQDVIDDIASWVNAH
jgi:dienelactone hydrolase